MSEDQIGSYRVSTGENVDGRNAIARHNIRLGKPSSPSLVTLLRYEKHLSRLKPDYRDADPACAHLT